MKYKFFSIASNRDKISKSFRKESCILSTLVEESQSFSHVDILRVHLNSESKGMDSTLLFSLIGSSEYHGKDTFARKRKKFVIQNEYTVFNY